MWRAMPEGGAMLAALAVPCTSAEGAAATGSGDTRGGCTRSALGRAALGSGLNWPGM